MTTPFSTFITLCTKKNLMKKKLVEFKSTVTEVYPHRRVMNIRSKNR